MKFNIRPARESCGMTQAELADLLGINPVTLSGYETGKHDPKSPMLIKISQICGVSVDYLLGREDIDNSLHADILYISRPSDNMQADEIRKFLHGLIDEMDDDDLLLMKDLTLRISNNKK